LEEVMKYRKKPVVIEARQLDANNADELAKWSGAIHGEHGFFIQTLEGVMKANQGDWVIQGIGGEFYPCKPDIFDATYVLDNTPPPEPEKEQQGDE
jgi:hypothetical protein